MLLYEMVIRDLQELNEDAIVLDGLDEAIIGIHVRSEHQSSVLVYDLDKIIHKFMDRDDMDEEEAMEFVGRNITGAFVGNQPNDPIFIMVYREAE